MYENCEVMTSVGNSLRFEIMFIRTGQEMSQLSYFLKKDLSIIFAPICREMFMLSFEIMVILDWTSAL